MKTLVGKTRRTRITQSSRDSGYSAIRQMGITSYQGRWNGYASSQARLSASAGRIAGRAPDPAGAGSRHHSSAARATVSTTETTTSPDEDERALAVVRSDGSIS